MANQFIEMNGQRIDTGVDAKRWSKMSFAQKESAIDKVFNATPSRPSASSKKPTSSAPEINTLAEVARSAIGQGAMLGFGDELEAAMRTGSFSSPEYKSRRDDFRARQEEYRRQNPYASLATEIGGGLLIPGGLLASTARAGAKGAAQTLAKEAKGVSSNLLRKAGIGAASGAGAGSVAGAGTADEMSDLQSNMIQGGITGAAIGAVAPSAVSALSQTAGALGNRLGLGAANFSDRKVRQSLAREGFTPEQALARVKELQGQGLRGATLADIGENTQNLAFGAMAIGNDMQTPVARQLTDRFRSQAEEISDQMSQRLGTTTDDSAEYLKNLAQRQSQQARSAYPEAYAVDLPSSEFESVLTNPRFEEIYETARELSDLRRMRGGDGVQPMPSFEEFGQLADRGTLPTEFLHQVKRGFDAVIESGTDITGKMSSKAQALAGVKKDFNEKIKELNPAYAKANKEFADIEQLKTANKVGLDIDKIPERELTSKVGGMSLGEKDAFLNGLVNRFNTLVETTGRNQDFVRQVFNKGRRRNAIRRAFPEGREGQKQFDDFVDFMESQERLARTNAKVLGGSPTATRQQILRESGEQPGDGIIDLLSDGGAGIVRRSLTKAVGMPEKAANQTLQTLFETDPNLLTPLVSRLQRQQQQMANPQGLGLLSDTARSPALIGVGGASAAENLNNRNRQMRKRVQRGLLQ